jgi:hypothetical protein
LHFGDPWAPDPACYLTDKEIGLDEEKQRELQQTNEVFAPAKGKRCAWGESQQPD